MNTERTEEFVPCAGNHVHKECRTCDRTDESTLFKMAELFKVFGDSTRVRILNVLLEQDMCVCDIAAGLGMTQSAISHQLRVLKETGLVKNERVGKTVLYSLDDYHVKDIFVEAMDHVKEKRKTDTEEA